MLLMNEIFWFQDASVYNKAFLTLHDTASEIVYGVAQLREFKRLYRILCAFDRGYSGVLTSRLSHSYSTCIVFNDRN